LRIDADQLRYPFYGSDANSTAKASVEEYVGAYRRRNIAQAAPAAELRIPRDGEQRFHGIVNTDSTAT
jgi:hypothetical protein